MTSLQIRFFSNMAGQQRIIRLLKTHHVQAVFDSDCGEMETD